MADDIVVELTNDLSEIVRLAEIVEAFIERNRLPESFKFNLNLCLDELVTNIISYGYPDENAHVIWVRLSVTDELLRLEVEDDGKEFNPLDKADPDINAELDDRPIGGLGIYFIRTLMDEVEYHRRDAHNHLIMVKSLRAADDGPAA